MPGFHHSVAILPLLFRRSAVVKCRCSVKNYVRKFHSVRHRDTQRQRKRQRQSVYGNGNGKREQRNGNGRTATEWWKSGTTTNRLIWFLRSRDRLSDFIARITYSRSSTRQSTPFESTAMMLAVRTSSLYNQNNYTCCALNLTCLRKSTCT